MSSRQLRKLQKQKELEQLEAQNAAEASDGSDEDHAPAPKSKPSAFSGFAALDMGDAVSEDEEKDPADEQETPQQTIDDAPPAQTPKNPSKSSKKKKKKKAAKKETDNVVSTPSPKVEDDAIDEIDKALRELNQPKKGGAPDATAEQDEPAIKAYERICELLRINTQNLQVLKEMYNFFGREAVASAQQEEQQEIERQERQRWARRRGGQRVHVDMETLLRGRPGESLPEVTLRRNPFLPGKEKWPKAPVEGLTMAQVEEGECTAVTKGSVAQRAGAMEFTFEHNAAYNKLEGLFWELVQLYDPMRLLYNLVAHPYHVSTLIQVSKTAQRDQNNLLCGDLCERALFTFGRVSISSFRQCLEQGKARLEFRRPENRQFWLASYHYLKSLVVKGTYRTALEWAKLIFSMDLSDPYGVIHFIHPLAIRAYQSKWFIDFCDSEALDECNTEQDYIRQTLILARLQQKDEAGAKTLLIEGMERLPWLYSGLFQALGLDVPKAIWGMQPRDQNEKLWVTIYIHQTKGLWDNTQATTLLRETAAQLQQKPDVSTVAPSPPLVEWNLARFIYLDNTQSLMAEVPPALLAVEPNYDFDPLPPDQNIFSHDLQRNPWMPRDQQIRTPIPSTGLEGGGRQRGNADMEAAVQAMVENAPPQNMEELEMMRQLLRQQGVPPDVLRILDDMVADFGSDADGGAGSDHDDDDGTEALGDEDGGIGGDGGDGGGEAPGVDGQRGTFERLMERIFGGAPDHHSGAEGDDGVAHAAAPAAASASADPPRRNERIPGAWVEDDDEEEEDGRH